jgi:NAD(P)H-dependent FMN reductase
MILVISSSLHPDSRSRILAQASVDRLVEVGEPVEFFDLSIKPLPLCDGATAYGDPYVQELTSLIARADGVLLAAPVYNYDVNSAAKNAIELTGRAWTGKVVGLMLAAGGQGSYMSAMGVANSLMLDFRCIIVPRFLYATGDSFEGSRLADESVQQRVEQLVADALRITRALDRDSPSA